MDKITPEEVESLARLARVGLTETEKVSLAEQMTEILEYSKELDSVNVTNVIPTSQVTGLYNVYREDKIKRSAISREDLLANAPEIEVGAIKVKAVL